MALRIRLLHPPSAKSPQLPPPPSRSACSSPTSKTAPSCSRAQSRPASSRTTRPPGHAPTPPTQTPPPTASDIQRYANAVRSVYLNSTPPPPSSQPPPDKATSHTVRSKSHPSRRHARSSEGSAASRDSQYKRPPGSQNTHPPAPKAPADETHPAADDASK